MFDLSEENVARLLMRDAQQLAGRARDVGATAYAQKPVHRVKPNEQFLQATLRNVESGNRRAEENAMWRQRRAQIAGHSDRNSSDHADVEHSAEDLRSRELSDANAVRKSDQDNIAVDSLLLSRPVRDEEMYNCTSALQTLVKSDSKPLSSFGCCCRGRGGVGSRLEETGPYLPSDTDAAWETSSSPRDSKLLGPDCPEWIRQASNQVEDSVPSSSSMHRSSRRHSEGARGSVKDGRVLKGKSSAKKDKKIKKNHKHKHRHKEVF